MTNRSAMLGKIAIGRKQLPGLEDEEAYRGLLLSVTGERRASKMNTTQLARVIDHMARQGAVFTSPNKKRGYVVKAGHRRSDFYEIPDGTPHAEMKRLICALWKQLEYDMLLRLKPRLLRA